MERAIIANRKHDKGEVRKEMSERKMKRVEDSLTEQSHLLIWRTAACMDWWNSRYCCQASCGNECGNCCSRQYVFQSRSQSERYHRSHRTAYTCGTFFHGSTYWYLLWSPWWNQNHDEHQHPVEVPGLIIEGVTQQIENEAAQKRAKLWKVRRQEGF